MILCSGCFDGLHAGHVAYLTVAADLRHWEELFVAVAPDSYIRRTKGHQPRWGQLNRCNLVMAVKGVNEAWPDPSQTPAEVIREKKPRIFLKGSEWAGRLPADVVAACQEVGCQILYLEMLDIPHNSEAPSPPSKRSKRSS